MFKEGSFKKLSRLDKLRLLYGKGDFIVSIRYYKHKVNLYNLQGLLVEVFYDSKSDSIFRVQPLDPGHSRINFYTDQIKLPGNMLN